MQSLREWLRDGRFSLAMSSGFFGFFAHAGVLSVLEDEDLLPERLSGSSAGALVTGAWASGLPCDALRAELSTLRREHFWDVRLGLGLLAGKLFRDKLHALLPTRTFDACRAPVAISVYDVRRLRTRVLERGDLAEAIHASCAVPAMFHPVWIDGAPCVDGGVADRAGVAGLPAGDRVLHHHLLRGGGGSSANPRLPRRANTVSLIIDELPRLGPFRLGDGLRAFEHARAATRRALQRPVGPAVRV